MQLIASQKTKQMKNIIILGAGESGVGAALLAKKQGWSVFVSDVGMIKDLYKKELTDNGIAFEEGTHSVDKIVATADLVIKSPGISEKAEIIKALCEKGVEIVDEIEFASRYTDAIIIAITGSNGKTTTTRLVWHILKTAGYKVGLAGNVGFSLAKQVAIGDMDYYALELSSFQLDGCTSFRPKLAILTNITPDHLDRYDYKLENYIASKFRIVQNKRLEDVFIYNNDDENIKYGFHHFWKQESGEGCIPISMQALAASEQEELEVEHCGYRIRKADLTIQGWHNRFNISAAVLAAKQLGVSDEEITRALITFENEAHRLEPVVTIQEVTYINDSKATNVDSVFYALEAMTQPIVWIVGGVDKGNDYSPLFDLVRQKVRAIVCLGKDNSKIIAAFSPITNLIVEAHTMQEAIKVSSLYAEKGDVVLLSPACASFDLFNNYEHRGNTFKEILLEQHTILTAGVSAQINLNINMNPGEGKTDGG